MSMREFLDLYGVLPASEERDRDPVAALAPLLEWAVRHRNRAVKQPALFYVCAAQGEAEQRRLPECEAPQASRQGDRSFHHARESGVADRLW